MVTTALYNQEGEKIGQVDLNPIIFDVEPQKELLEAAVRTQLAVARSPIAAVKTRAEVRGGGRKPWRQKGTGRARHGSIRSPLWKGGGVTFGPSSQQNWSLKMNKKARQKALFMSLTGKVRENSLAVLENIKIDEAKTAILDQTIKQLLGKLNGYSKGVLLVTPNKDQILQRAGRNLTYLEIISANSLNVFEILKARNLIVLQEALPIIERTYLANNN